MLNIYNGDDSHLKMMAIILQTSFETSTMKEK